MITNISVDELARLLKTEEAFTVLDVREPDEFQFAKLSDPRAQLCPMSQLARAGIAALPDTAKDPEARIYVLCHHGNRSATVTNFLQKQGWKNVSNVKGGIDEFARRIDRSVGLY